MLDVRSNHLLFGAATAAIVLATGCLPSNDAGTGASTDPVVADDAGDDAQAPDADAPLRDGGTPETAADGGGGCGVANAYGTTLPAPVTNKGVVIYGPGGPTSGMYFRVTTTAGADPNGRGAHLLFLERGDVLGGPSNGLAATGYREIGRCTENGCREYTRLLGNARVGDDFRLAALTQLHHPRLGYGTFELVQIEPRSGATVRAARLFAGGAAPANAIVFANAVTASGDDVIVTGTSNVPFGGETGAGINFRMKLAGFLAPACDGASVLPSEIVRSETPLDP